MIEWSQLEELETEMGDAFPEIVSLFLEEAGAIVERLKSANPNDAATLVTDLHALKGAALNLGLTQFAALCAEGEKRAEDGQAGAIALPVLFASFDESCAALERRLTRGVA